MKSHLLKFTRMDNQKVYYVDVKESWGKRYYSGDWGKTWTTDKKEACAMAREAVTS